MFQEKYLNLKSKYLNLKNIYIDVKKNMEGGRWCF